MLQPIVDFLANKGLYGIVEQIMITKPGLGNLIIPTYYAFLALCIAIAYLIGSLNSAIIISRVFCHDDIRRHGSGNAGTTNMLRTFGHGAAIATLVCDALKSALVILLSAILVGGIFSRWALFFLSPGVYIAMLFCILGHIYPVYFKMKGGKGVLCASICIAMLSPIVFLVLLIIFIGTVLFTKYVSLGSILCAACYPLFLNSLAKAFGFGMGEMMLPAFLIMGLLLFAHRDNIKRLYNHKENKISFRKKPKDAANDGSSPSNEEV